jgi:hypothetical protein
MSVRIWPRGHNLSSFNGRTPPCPQYHRALTVRGITAVPAGGAYCPNSSQRCALIEPSSSRTGLKRARFGARGLGVREPDLRASHTEIHHRDWKRLFKEAGLCCRSRRSVGATARRPRRAELLAAMGDLRASLAQGAAAPATANETRTKTRAPGQLFPGS